MYYSSTRIHTIRRYRQRQISHMVCCYSINTCLEELAPFAAAPRCSASCAAAAAAASSQTGRHADVNANEWCECTQDGRRIRTSDDDEARAGAGDARGHGSGHGPRNAGKSKRNGRRNGSLALDAYYFLWCYVIWFDLILIWFVLTLIFFFRLCALILCWSAVSVVCAENDNDQTSERQTDTDRWMYNTNA